MCSYELSSTEEIGVDSERMGDPDTIKLIFILLFNVDVYIYCFMSQYMQYYM
jgi:hypothetical protein